MSARAKPPTPTEADVAWAEERALALIGAGVPSVVAIAQAATECARIVTEEQAEYRTAIAREIVRRREERKREKAAELERRRTRPVAKETSGIRQTRLTASLGDLLKRKEPR